MKDDYPQLAPLPADHLVPRELQPEYLSPDSLGPTVPLAEALCDQHVRLGRGDQPAIIDDTRGRALTFAELTEASSRLANALSELGVRPGERVAFRFPNRPEALIAAIAAWRLGAVVVPTPVQARESELRFFLEDTGATALIADGRDLHFDSVPAALEGTAVDLLITVDGPARADAHGWDKLLAAAAPTFSGPPAHPDGPAIIWHTGGTTGTPKACYHTQRRFLLGGYAVGLSTGVRAGERWCAAAPVGHALGFIYHTNFTLLHGATVVLVEDFGRAEAVLGAIAKHRVDTFTAVVASWARLKGALEAEPASFDASSLTRAFGMWQTASSSEVSDYWSKRGLELMNNFGSTAFATWVLVPRSGTPHRWGSLGQPSPGFDVRASDLEGASIGFVPQGEQGRMVVRGVTGLTYWNRLDLQARDVIDGWTVVDDLIAFDEHGNADYLGRTDYLISSAGYKIAPVEVETVLCRHPVVREVAVVGAPDPIRQEIVSAFVALHPGAIAGDDLRRELQDLVKRELSPYKYPRRIEFVDALPRDSVGKVQMRILADRARAGS